MFVGRFGRFGGFADGFAKVKLFMLYDRSMLNACNAMSRTTDNIANGICVLMGPEYQIGCYHLRSSLHAC